MTSPVELLNKAISLHQQGNLVDAEAVYKKVLIVDSNDFDALHMLGIINAQHGAFQEAEKLLGKALSVDSKVAPCFHNYGTVLAKLKRFEDAVNSYNSAIKLAPNHAPIYSDRGNALFELKRYDEAHAAYDRALALNPNFSDAWVGRGNVFFKLKHYDEAFGAYDKALALKPDLANAWFGRGNVFNELKRYDEALAAYDKALALKPDLDGAEGFRLHAKMHLCDWSNFDAECNHLIASVRDGKNNAPPFTLLAIPSSSEDQLQSAKLWIGDGHPPSGKPIWQGDRYDHDRIRVAYLSADFRDHPMSSLMVGIFECHDKSRFDVTAISFGPDSNSEMRQRLKVSFERFIDAKTFSDDQIAKLARSLEVDILVDLMGFTTDSRTGIFARRPAPIQVNYLGYPGTMGAEYIDYIIADPIVIPENQYVFYAEKVFLLPYSYYPTSYQINDAKRSTPDRAFTRFDVGLPSTGFVFCCFNNIYKITPHVFDCWMRILKQVEGSVLWLLEGSASAASNLKKEALARGVSSECLVFAKRMPLPDHLARHRLSDLFLDTLPCNAHTTASDALWAGLPVLTCLGKTFAGRVAASLLNAIRLPELITTTLEAYEQMAIDLATNPEKLAVIKRKLAANRLTTPLFDTKLHTKHIEAAYTAIYERHQAGLAPDHIVIPN